MTLRIMLPMLIAASSAPVVPSLCTSPLGAQVALFNGSLSGSVLADSADAAIANAEIKFPKLKLSARSDSKGNFQITGIPAGAHDIMVRVVGFQPYAATLTFHGSQKLEADFLLKPVVTKLANVNVNAAADKRYASRLYDFEDRRHSSPGRFLTADVFEKAIGQNMSQVLISRIPGLRTVGKSSQQVLVATRDAKQCAVQVIVNGMIRYNGRLGEPQVDINTLYTNEVIAVEYYTVSSTPAQFGTTGGQSGGSQCGTILIWTK